MGTLVACAARKRPGGRSLGPLTGALCALVALVALGGTGFGASSASSSKTVTATVLATISLSDPTAINSSPAPTAGTTWTDGGTNQLGLGELQPTDTAQASLTWKVTTSSSTGYQVTLANAGTAPLMKSGANSLADMPTSPAALDATKSHFGVAAGDPVNHGEGAVAFAGTPWGTTGGSGSQGTLFRSIPTAGMVVASRTSGQTNDPFTLTFTATSVASQPVSTGSYTGTARITASVI